MLQFFKKIVVVSLFSSMLLLNVSGESQYETSRLIRRVYLDFLKYPPTPSELEWYITYNNNSFEVAVDWVSSQINNPKLKNYLNSSEYKKREAERLTTQEIISIIKYQCGKAKIADREADQLLTQHAMRHGEGDVLAATDYIAVCLMGRETTTQEANNLMSTFKLFKTEKEGYLAILDQIKEYKDTIYK